MKTVYNDEWLEETMAELTEEECETLCQVVEFTLLQMQMESHREQLRKMTAEERRLFCNDVEKDAARLFGNRTGKFFNEMAGSTKPRKTDDRELGRRIMAKRNVNYRGTDPDEEGRNI